MIIGIGTDIVEVARVKSLIDNYKNVIDRIFTTDEIKYCEQYKEVKYERFAARFAAKEAFSKAIGTGFSDSFVLKDVGVINNGAGKPELSLTGTMFARYGKYKLHLSLSHLKEFAVASVIIEE